MEHFFRVIYNRKLLKIIMQFAQLPDILKEGENGKGNK